MYCDVELAAEESSDGFNCCHHCRCHCNNCLHRLLSRFEGERAGFVKQSLGRTHHFLARLTNNPVLLGESVFAIFASLAYVIQFLIKLQNFISEHENGIARLTFPRNLCQKYDAG